MSFSHRSLSVLAMFALSVSAPAVPINDWLKETKANVVFADHTFSGDFRNLRLGEGAWDHYEHDKILRPRTITSVIVAPGWVGLFFAGEKFSGPFLALSAGHCPNLDKYGWNDRIMSLRFVPAAKAQQELHKLGLKADAIDYLVQGGEQKSGSSGSGRPGRAPAGVTDANINASAAADRVKAVCFERGVVGMFGPGCKEAKESYEKAEKAAKDAESKERADKATGGSKGNTSGGRAGGEGGRG